MDKDAWKMVDDSAHILEAHRLIAFGKAPNAAALFDGFEELEHADCSGSWAADFHFWRGLTAAQCWSPALAEDERTAFAAKLDQSMDRFRQFTRQDAQNLQDKSCLLEAEHARIHGLTDVAMTRYDNALAWAHENGSDHIEALAAQVCAEFHARAGRPRFAAIYLSEACAAYERCGANTVIGYLASKYPALFDISSGQSTNSTTLTTTGSLGKTAVDVDIVVRAAQALAADLDPTRVVERLMNLVLETAGAQCGVLLLAQGESLAIVARLSVEQGCIETQLSEPLGHDSAVATTVVHYAARSSTPVVIDDALTDKRFATDPYLAKHAIRSLLAVPLAHQGRLGGVLHLEHRDATSAFPPARVSLLSVLATQAAIAVENAVLYRNVQEQLRALDACNKEIQQLHDELQRQIQQCPVRVANALVALQEGCCVQSTLHVGALLGDCYRVVRLIGAGGMGSVYEVERTTDGMPLAAKILHITPDRNNLARFAREAQILASLNHPNLISIFDVDITMDGLLYIVMEFVAGTSLRHHLEDRGGCPYPLQIIRQVAEALAALHSRAIVHRDLKPENILLVADSANSAPIVKLADFGIAVTLDDEATGPDSRCLQPPDHVDEHAHEALAFNHLDNAHITTGSWQRAHASASFFEPNQTSRLTRTGAIMGTPFYIAPELCHGSRYAQPASDIFSLGVIAYELLVGERPSAGPPVLGGFERELPHIGMQLVKCRGMTPPLANLFQSCLSMDPARRPLASDVSSFLAKIT